MESPRTLTKTLASFSACGQRGRYTMRRPNADHVSRALLAAAEPSSQSPAASCAIFFRQQRKRLLNPFHAPGQDLPEGGNRHRRQNELRRLAHIEAARTGPIGIGVVDQPGEIVAAGARDPRLLQGHARLPPFWRDVEIAQSVRAEQPLVSHGRQEVRLYALEIERAGAERLAGIDDQCRRPRHAHARPTRSRSTVLPSVQ